MKKELVMQLYARMKKHDLNVNVLPLLLNEKDSVIEDILKLDIVEFIVYINDLSKNNNVKKHNFSSDELKSDIAYKLSLCTDRKILDSYYRRLINKGVKGEQLTNITNALKKLYNDETLEAILNIVENERIIKSKKIVELIESLSDVANKNTLYEILKFVENSQKKSLEIINLIIYILNIRNFSNTKMLIDLANLIDDYKSAKIIIEIVSNSTYGCCANAAYEYIKNNINMIGIDTIIKGVQIISKARGEDQANYARLLVTNYNDMDNVMEYASLIAKCNMAYQASQAFLVIKENRERNIDNLLDYVKLVINSYSREEAFSLCAILTNEDALKDGNAFEFAKKVTSLDLYEQMVFAAEFATNKKLIDRGIVFELIELCNRITDEKKFKLIYEIILRDEVLSDCKTLEIANILIDLEVDEIIFVKDNMLTKEIIENEDFINLISYLSIEEISKLKVELTKAIYLDNCIDFEKKLDIAESISKIKNNIMLDCISYIIMYIDVLGYEKAFKYIDEISMLDVQDDKVETCVLNLKIIEEIEKNILKQKNFLEIYKNSPELAMKLLEESEIPDEQDIVQTTRIRNIGKK